MKMRARKMTIMKGTRTTTMTRRVTFMRVTKTRLLELQRQLAMAAMDHVDVPGDWVLSWL